MENTPKKAPLSLQIDLKKFEKITQAEKEASESQMPVTTLWSDAVKRLKKNPLAMASLGVLAFLILLLIVSPFICPYSSSEILTINGVRDITAKNLAPLQWSERELEYMAQGGKLFPHLFGTDELCRDYYARVIGGTTVSLLVGITASLIVLVIGLLYGSYAGFKGGKIDTVMMRIVDIIYSLPDMLIIILLSVVLSPLLSKNRSGIVASLGPNMISLFIVFGLLYWVGMARLVRGQILSIRNMDYINAAKSMGVDTWTIIRRHVIPNCMSVVFIAAALQIPAAIFTESYLSFVGLGVQAPMPSLGSLANAARAGMQTCPYKLVIPSIMIALIVLSFNLLADGLRDAFDPRR